LLLSVVAALAAGGFVYFRLDDEIRRHFEQRLVSHYQHLTVHVGSARFEKDRGITVRDVSLIDTGGKAPQTLLAVDELFLAGNLRVEDLLTENLRIDQIVVRRPRLAALRQANGDWDVASLLPLPTFGDQAPTIVIEDASLTLTDATRGGAKPFTVRGITATLKPIVSASGDASAGRYHAVGAATSTPAGELRFDAEMGVGDGALGATIRVEGLELSPDWLASLPAPQSWPAMQLFGRADIVLRISRAAGASAVAEWSSEVKISRGRLEDERLPQPLTDLTLDVQADRQRLLVRGMTARCGAASVVMACDRRGWSAGAPLAARISVRDFTLDGDLPRFLPASFAPAWRRFQPEGKVDAELQLMFNGHSWRPHVVIDCRSISLTDSERFPYRVGQTAGRVTYAPAEGGESDRLSLDLTGVGGGGPIQIKAELRMLMADERAAGQRSHCPVGWIEVAGSDVAVHEPLLAAIDARSPQGGRFVRSLRPQGAFDLRWRAEWCDPAQPRADTSLYIVLKDCHVQCERFEYPLRRVRGLITERNRHWEIHDLEGRGGNDSMIVTCRGQADPSPAGHLVDLMFQASNVPLDDTLKQALVADAQKSWEAVRPQGRADFTARIIHETGQSTPTIDVRMVPREKSVSIEPQKYRFEEVEGAARFTAGRVELRGVTARHGRSTFAVKSGTWQAMPEGDWQFVLTGVSADRLTPQRDLLVALPPGLRNVIERVQPTGTFGLYDGAFRFDQRGADPRLAAAWDVKLDCHQVSLAAGVPLANITGTIRLTGQADGQTAFTAGELDIHSLSWNDIQLTAVRGPFWADASVCMLGRRAAAQQGRADLQPVTADAYGGGLTLDARLEHSAVPQFNIELALGGADLTRFANERLGGPRQLSGTVSGQLTLAGTGQSTRTLSGDGEVHVVNANIYELPIVVAMLKVLRIRSPSTTAFNQCDMRFRIQGEDVLFSQVNLLGDAVSLLGEGKTGFDRRLDLVFYSLVGPADLPIPFYKAILGQASQQMMQVKVAGTWDVPEPELKPLPAVNDALLQIQNELQAGAATMTSPSSMRDTFAPPRR
jgi:hypothetical protein